MSHRFAMVNSAQESDHARAPHTHWLAGDMCFPRRGEEVTTRAQQRECGALGISKTLWQSSRMGSFLSDFPPNEEVNLTRTSVLAVNT